MKVNLEGKSIVVTGASSGIGAATARLLAECGAQVLAVSRTVSAASFDGVAGVRTFAADLADAASVPAIIAEATRDGRQIDGIVNAAGHFSNTALADATVEELDLLWQVHVRTPYLLTQAALPHLSDGSSLVFVSSTVARVGFAPFAAYTAVKGAIDSLSRSLAIELAPRTRVNTIMPGFTQTTMMTTQYETAPALEEAIVVRTPTGMIGGPEYAANVIALLCSDDSAYTTASAIVVDGGWSGQGWQAP
jgi:NAD(P)-dependent dehydrogenase (short-subunit alcohol dehydrogenase family)